MNFFAHQDKARRRTRLLVLLFGLTTLAIIAAVNLVVVVLAANTANYGGVFVLPDPAWLRANTGLVLWTSVLSALLIGSASLYRMASLSGGGGSVAQGLGGTLVAPDVQDAALRRLRNVVEEMALASGLPVPEIYVLEEESAINAFAAGFTPSDAAIAVTRGALEQLSREELQGVIAHEFSHILNGDMRLNMRLMGVLFGIMFIGLVGRTLLRGSTHARVRASRRGSGAGMIVAVGLALLVVGYVGLLGARLIKAAVSRQREFLADASAVQFTRHPAGIAGALKKIGGYAEGGALRAAGAEEISHMLFIPGRAAFAALFATHPPIEARIRAIDPYFNPARPARSTGRAPQAAAAAFGPGVPADTRAIDPQAVAAEVGNPNEAQVRGAARLHAALPPALLEAAHSSREAPALVVALLLSEDAAARGAQLALVARRAGAALGAAAEAKRADLAPLGPAYRLPLLELTFPALKHRPRAQLEALSGLLEELMRVDGVVSVFEYALTAMLRAQLLEAAAPDVGQGRARSRARPGDLQSVFSVLARAGHSDARAARAAYEAGIHRLLPLRRPDYAPPDRWVEGLDRALSRLDALSPLAKEQLVQALAATVSHDGRISVQEAELLRAICARLHCPLPPLFG